MTQQKECTTRNESVEPKKRRSSLVLVILFSVVIALPCVGMVFDWDLYPPQDENRALADLTVLENVAVEDFPDRFNAYFKDNFAFRNLLIRRYRKLRQNVMGTRSYRVLVGKNEWLFFTKHGIVSDYRGRGLLTNDELERWKRSFEVRKTWLEKRGIHYLFVIAPNKIQVYPENLPDELRKIGGPSRANQLVTYVKACSDVDILYLKEALLKAKEKHVLYLSNDTHWNDRGSFVAYTTVINHLTARYPQLQLLKESNCLVEKESWRGDLGKMLELEEKYLAPRERLVPDAGSSIVIRSLSQFSEDDERPERLRLTPPKTWMNPKGKERALIFHDSFADYGFKKTFPETFGEVTFIADYSESETLKTCVEHLKPTIVIEVMVERNLGQMNDYKTVMQYCKPFSIND